MVFDILCDLNFNIISNKYNDANNILYILYTKMDDILNLDMATFNIFIHMLMSIISFININDSNISFYTRFLIFINMILYIKKLK